jgi:hypothetical protein
VATIVDPSEVYSRVTLSSFDAAKSHERLVFLLVDFDVRMDTEGWDDFFTSESTFPRYPELKNWLDRIDDRSSLAVLEAYERAVRSAGYRFERSEIERWLVSQSDEDLATAPDWRDQYAALATSRWAAARRYLEQQGVSLRGA